jgi:hypothetical protein
MSRREFIDKHLHKWVSRKLLVFIVAVLALFTEKITSEDFTLIAIVYIGSQTVVDWVTKLLAARGGNSYTDVDFYNKKTDNDTSRETY